MSAEAVSLAKLAVQAAVRDCVQDQYHYATLLQLDALARGAKGPEVDLLKRTGSLMHNRYINPVFLQQNDDEVIGR